MPSVVRTLLSDGFSLLSFSELGGIVGSSRSERLYKSVLDVLYCKEFCELHHSAFTSDPRDKEDDPTSLGFQFFTNFKEIQDFDKISAFGSLQMIGDLKKSNSYSVCHDNVDECLDTVVFSSIPNELDVHMKELCLNFSNCGNEILTQLINHLDLKKEYSQNEIMEILGKSQHETLINFYTDYSIPMYPHVDHSTITLLLVPSLFYFANESTKPNFIQLPNMNNFINGLQVQTKEEEWINIDNQIFNSLITNKNDVYSSKSVLILLGNHLNKLSQKRIHCPVHQISGANRHTGRISIANFMNRNLFELHS